MGLASRGIRTVAFGLGLEEHFICDSILWHPAADTIPALDEVAAVVVDSYRITLRDLELPVGAETILMHDRSSLVDPASLVVNIAADTSAASLTRLFGVEYACLRSSFWGLPRRSVNERVRRVLVATGAGDLDGAGEAIAARVSAALPGTVSLVRGPYATASPPAGVRVIDSPESLIWPLLNADIVITAGGQTMLEAAATGAACVAMPLVDNQAPQVAALAHQDAVVVATIRDADRLAVLLADDTEQRHRLATRAQETIDGYGALRVAFRLAERLQGRPDTDSGCRDS